MHVISDGDLKILQNVLQLDEVTTILVLGYVTVMYDYPDRLSYSISHILWNLKVHHSVYKSATDLYPTPDDYKPHFLPYFSKINFSIIFQPKPVSQHLKVLEEHSVCTSLPSHMLTIKHHASSFHDSTVSGQV
jgi:hypothetical protein